MAQPVQTIALTLSRVSLVQMTLGVWKDEKTVSALMYLFHI